MALNTKRRLNLVLSEASRQRIDRLAEVTEADTSAEVVKHALQMYETIVNAALENKEFVIRDKASGEATLFQPFRRVPTRETAKVEEAPAPGRMHRSAVTPQPALG